MKVLVTGGAGFIGSNCVARFAEKEFEVTVFDDLSRNGSPRNLEWLKASFPILFVNGDVRKPEQIIATLQKHGPFDLIIHLAAQVAVTTSVLNPRDDFERNAYGAFNLLESVRIHNPDAVILYSSTNKVYGAMEHLGIVERNNRYGYADLPGGVHERHGLDFHSPYGCSKGTADQYFRDFSRIYGMKTVVFRQSCIYGYRQFGVEDQGWVAWFCIAAAQGKELTICGDGKQVRDILFIDDLVNLYERAFEKIDIAQGRVYNIGGGPENTVSLLELISQLESITRKKIPIRFEGWRNGDQKVFIADVSSAWNDLQWKPTIRPNQGVELLYNWVKENLRLFE